MQAEVATSTTTSQSDYLNRTSEQNSFTCKGNWWSSLVVLNLGVGTGGIILGGHKKYIIIQVLNICEIMHFLSL